MTVAIVLVLAGSCVPLLLVLWRPGRPGDSRPDSDDGGGGGNQRREPPRPRGSGGGEPPWWPAFERDFADYVQRLKAPRAGRY